MWSTISRGLRAASILLVLACSLSCAENTIIPVDCNAPTPEEGPIGVIRSPLIYGEDDRREVFQLRDRALENRALETVVALIDRRNLDMSDPNDIRVKRSVDSLGESKDLCDFERFSNQPTAARCSGILIDDDLIMTAGHCLKSRDCSGTMIVFGYSYDESPAALRRITSDDVFECSQRVIQENFMVEGNTAIRDFAIARLDRSAAPRFNPAALPSGDALLPEGTRVTMIGFPSGIPVKIDQGGRVLDSGSLISGGFRLSTDSYAGNSGSGLFTIPVGGSEPVLVGMLVQGKKDYVVEPACGCGVSNQLPDDGGEGGGETGMYSRFPVDLFCATEFSPRLCGSPIVCGDGACSSGENATNCPDDCLRVVCGDGVCNTGETEANCPDDCMMSVVTAPPEWECEPEWYGDRQYCDCDCGVLDLDCDDPEIPLDGCGDDIDAAWFCDPFGECRNGNLPPAPPEWECPGDYYGSSDGCDCNCGAFDPDCEDSAQADSPLNCPDGEYTCNSAGVCEER